MTQPSYSYGKRSDEPYWFVERREVIARAPSKEEAERMVKELEENVP